MLRLLLVTDTESEQFTEVPPPISPPPLLGLSEPEPGFSGSG